MLRFRPERQAWRPVSPPAGRVPSTLRARPPALRLARYSPPGPSRCDWTARACAPCRSRRCGSRRQAPWRSGWPTDPRPIISSKARRAHRSTTFGASLALKGGKGIRPAALSSGSAFYSNHSNMSYKASNRRQQRRAGGQMTNTAPSTPVQMGARRFGRVNWLGLMTLAERENRRFLAVWTQTLLAPLITAGLFMVIFSIAIGPRRGDVMGADFTTFIAPGILMMTVIQNAFANTSSSLMISKVQGNIVDTLMPPLSAGELVLGYMVGGTARGLAVAIALILTFMLVLGLIPHAPLVTLVFVLLGAAFLSALGLIAAIYAQKFDQMAAITNFIITPLAFLSGTFYSVQALPPIMNEITHLNPVFYLIDGVRFGVIGVSDSAPMLGLAVGAGATLAVCLLAWWMLARGYRLKA